MSLIFVLLAPFVGGLVYGVERKLKARMQGRMGPPLLQPFYDFLKLANKRTLIIHPYHAYLGVLHFVTVYVAVAMLFFGADILIVIFTHLLATLFLVVAAYSANSIFSHVGASRELVLVAVYEPIFAICAVCFYLANGSFEVSSILGGDAAIYKYPFVFSALLAAIAIKLKKSPFDAAEAHQEIVGGAEIEYSGIYFEAIYTAKWLDYVYAYSFCFLFAGSHFVLGGALALAAFFALNVMDNSTARVKYVDVIGIFARFIYPAALLNIIVIGWLK
jgi:ech hydrogenase subunit B